MRAARPRHVLLVTTAVLATTLVPVGPALAAQVDPPETVHLVVGDLPVAATDGDTERSATVTPDAPFSLLGLTLPDGVASAEVRTRDLDGSWSAWTELEVDEPGLDGPDPGTEEALDATENVTEPLWVGGADAFQVRLDGEVAEVDVTLIDTQGLSEGTFAKLARHLTPRWTAPAAEANAARPTIITRAGWKADESLRKGSPSYATPRFAVIHHTAGSNSYAASDSPAIMRSMYSYHTQTRGWADLGYNLVVDKYGQVFEGRAGGVDRGVVGAHASGFNSGSIGVSVIGNYDTVDIPDIALQRVADVVAWKYGIHNIDAGAARTVSVNGTTLNTTAMHRDVGQTACPGRFFVAKIGSLRTMIASRASAPPPPPAPTVPGVPTGVSASAGNAAATVTWSAPASTGGSTITGYTVTASPGGRTATVAGTARTATVTGLTNGTATTFTVRATNAVGSSAASSASAAVTPIGPPGAPTAVSATSGSRSATVTWTPPVSTGGSAITGYSVTATPGGRTATVTGTATSATVTDLVDGTPYTFTVTAQNAAGSSGGAATVSAVTPLSAPSAPTAVSATPGDTTATVTWTAPSSNGGTTITGYTVTASPGDRTATVAGSLRTATVTGLTNGTAYTFTVRATNSVGSSAASSPSTGITPVGAPGAPTAVSATAGNATATVTWTTPTSTGGSAITGYTVTASPGGRTATVAGTGRTATVTGLTNGTAYTFTVRATNAVGTSAASAASAAVTPIAPPPPAPAVSQTPRPTVGQPIPVVGDWNGDGRSQVGWFHNGWWNLPTGRNNTTVRFQYGGRNDLPVVGDWNGNGRDGIGTVRDGTWRLRQTPTAGTPTLTFTYGRPTDLPVAGDFNGNGRDGIGVYRNGRWLLRQTATAGTATLAFTYGTANDRPIVGDFNANGRDGIGTVTDATWRLRHTATAGTPQLTFAYGRPTDWPQTGDFNRNRQHTPLVVRADKWLISNHLPTRPADITLTYSPTATQLR
jgi:hypothetical protein